MKKSKLKIAAIIFLVLGVLVMFFPQICNKINNKFMRNETQKFDNVRKQLSEKEFDELYSMMKLYNETLFKNGQKELSDPFSYEESSFDLSKYGLNDGIVGYIDIPKLDLHAPIYLGANEENMAKGVAQLGKTSLPIGGKNTNCVLAGHRGMRTKEMFLHIDKLQPGDEIIVTNFREKLYYSVVETKVISPYSVNEILIQPGKDLITLISCHPYPQNYQRYLVFCERKTEKSSD